MLNKINFKVKELEDLLMEICIKDNIMLDYKMGMEFLFQCNKDGDTMEIGLKEKYMVKVLEFGMMELFMMECGLIG